MLLKKNIPFKYVFGKIKYEIVIITVYATLIALSGALPDYNTIQFASE